MSFLIKDEEVEEKYKHIWDVIKNKLKMKFHSEPVYEYKYLKTKVKEYDGAINFFLSNSILKENIHYICMACITIASFVKMDEKYIPQVYLKECKYKIRKTQMSSYIIAELKSVSDDDSNDDSDRDSDSESDDDFDDDFDDDSDDDSHK